MDNWTHSMKCGVLTGTITACLATPTEQEAFFLFVTMCLRLDTHYGGGRGRRAGGEWHTHRVLLESLPGKNNSPVVCMCSASRVSAAVWQTHAAQRRSLRKRSHGKLPFERCCTDELSACVHETIRRRRADRGLGVCAVSPAWLWPRAFSCSVSVC